MPHNNNQLVKRSEAYFLEFPCGYSSTCCSVRGRELKAKLHRKQCKSCHDKHNLPISKRYVIEGDKDVMTCVMDQSRVYKS